MSETEKQPATVWRNGIALSLRLKPELDARLAALGLENANQLVNLFVTGEGVVEALKPVAENWAAARESKRTPQALRKEAVAKVDDDTAALMASMTPEQIAAALRAAQGKS